MGSAPAPGQRKRAKHTRSRDGCRVCRIRRVRCDETRPACLKCVSTGRTCEGYPPAPPTAGKATTALILPRAVPSALSGDPLEQRSLSYFTVRTARQFAASFDDGFWSESVLQRGTHELCIRHAIVALGALHEAFDNEHQLVGTSREARERAARLSVFAGEHYAQAVSVLNKFIVANGWKGLDVSLLCCIMCIAFEWLRGNYMAAGMHLSSGLVILRQWSEERGPTGPTISYSSPAGHFIRGKIAPLFTRLTIQARTLDTNRPPTIPWSPKILEARLRAGEDKSAVAARADLDVLLSEVYLKTENFQYAFPDILMKESVRAYCQTRLAEWYTEYRAHIFPLGTEKRTYSKASTEQLSLSVWHTLVTIMLETGHTADQTAYDAFTPHFRHMVALVERLVRPPASITRKAPAESFACFQVDIETIPMLYFIGSRCRHPIVRREALDLLRVNAGREGLWDGSAQVRLLEELIAIEEEGLKEVVDEASVSGAARVYAVSEETLVERRQMILKVWVQGEGTFGPPRVLTW